MPGLENTAGHKIRKALDAIAGKPTGRLEPLTGRRANTFRLNYATDIEGMTESQNEFITAICKFRAIHQRQPELIEAFHIAKSLGYRKQDAHHEAL